MGKTQEDPGDVLARLDRLEKMMAAFLLAMRDSAIQMVAGVEDSTDWHYDKSALAKRREKVRPPAQNP